MTNMMIVLMKTLTKLLTYTLIFVLFPYRWSDILLHSSICDGCCPVHRQFDIPAIFLRYHKLIDDNQWKNFLDLRGHYVRPFFKWPKQRESYDAALLNTFMYM